MEENQSKIRKILFNEISFVLSICAVVIGSVLFIVRPNEKLRTDMALLEQRVEMIEDNHISDLEKSIEILIEKDTKQDEIINQINIFLAKIATALGIE